MSKYMVFLGSCPSMKSRDKDEVMYFFTFNAVKNAVRVKKAYNAIVFFDPLDTNIYQYFCDASDLELDLDYDDE